MSPGRFACIAIGITIALAGCTDTGPNLNKPDPHPYMLRFVPDSISQPVGGAAMVAMHASLSSGGADIPIRVVEWAVDNPALATLTGSTVSTDGTIYATVIVTCQKAGTTSLVGNVTLGQQQQLSDKMPVTCTSAPSAATPGH